MRDNAVLTSLRRFFRFCAKKRKTQPSNGELGNAEKSVHESTLKGIGIHGFENDQFDCEGDDPTTALKTSKFSSRLHYSKKTCI